MDEADLAIRRRRLRHRCRYRGFLEADLLLDRFAEAWLDRLAPEDRRRFAALPRGVATLSPEELGRALPEPHPSWMNRIVAEWERRYSR